MGRGLGERQREVLDRLAGSDGWVPLHQLVDGHEDRISAENEIMRVRSAIRGLERRGLVRTLRLSDPDHRVKTRVVEVVGYRGWTPVYDMRETTRDWSGLHVQLVTAANAERWARLDLGLGALLDAAP